MITNVTFTLKSAEAMWPLGFSIVLLDWLHSAPFPKNEHRSDISMLRSDNDDND